MRKSWVLLVVGVVVALTACSSAVEPATTVPTPAASASPTATPLATAAIIVDDPAGYGVVADDGATWDGVHFVSPSGNEGCAILGAASSEPFLWGCALAAQDWAFPTASPDDYCFESQVPCGYGIEATGDEAPHPRYRGDAGFPAAIAIFDTTGTGPTVATLEEGHSVTFGAVTCEASATGITCSNAESGHGFAVSRAAYELH
jgi:hypothetical protein